MKKRKSSFPGIKKNAKLKALNRQGFRILATTKGTPFTSKSVMSAKKRLNKSIPKLKKRGFKEVRIVTYKIPKKKKKYIFFGRK